MLDELISSKNTLICYNQTSRPGQMIKTMGEVLDSAAIFPISNQS